MDKPRSPESPRDTVLVPPSAVLSADGPAAVPSSVADRLRSTPSDLFERTLHRPQVPGFDVLEEIGHGGMGVVFRARQQSLDRIVALKMVLAGEFAQPIALQRFLTEAKVIARIDHPGIIRVHEFGHHQGLPYFALDYLPGGSLAEQLKGRPQPPSQAAALVAKLAAAMQAAHDQGIIHRDLKPANVLLTATGEPKITDFGLAKQQDSQLTATGVALGTPCYMSPEQAEGSREVGPLSDVYALGAILYEMLTGRPPFLGVTPMETMARVLKEEPVPPLHLQPGTPADLNTVCLKCLEKDPRRRYASAADLAADLQRFLGGEPVLARPAGAMERGTKWVRRNPALAAMLGTATLGIIVLSVAVVQLVLARRQESAARLEAEAHARQARHAQQEAEANYRLARKAVDQLFVAVTGTDLLKQESMRPVRKLLLGCALPFYEQFRATRGDDRAVQAETALHLYRVAVITEEIGSAAEAKASYEKAAALYEKLLAADPDDADSQANLAEVWNNLGLLQADTGEKEEAARSYERALVLREKLAAAAPGTHEHQRVLARLWQNLGLLHRDQGQRQQALDGLRKSIALYEKLTVSEPDEVMNRAELSHVWANLGVLQQELGQLAEAARTFQQALPVLEKLAADFPRHSEHQDWLARLWGSIGSLQEETKQPAEAERSYRQALRLREKLAADHPDMVRYQDGLAHLHNRLATLLNDLGRHAEAEQHFTQAIAVYEKLVQAQPGVTGYRVDLGGAYSNRARLERTRNAHAAALPWYAKAVETLTAARSQEPGHRNAQFYLRNAHAGRAQVLDHLGDHAAAAQDWEQAAALNRVQREAGLLLMFQAVSLAKGGNHARAAALAQDAPRQFGTSAPICFGMARIYALCHAAVTQPSPLRAQYARQAVDCLKQAHAKGRFRAPRQLADLDKDPDFAALRTHPAYQAWRKNLHGGK